MPVLQVPALLLRSCATENEQDQKVAKHQQALNWGTEDFSGLQGVRPDSVRQN